MRLLHVVLLSGIATAVFAAETEPPKVAARFAAPVKVEAKGGPIDVEIGHAAPFYGDFDGDGVNDLLVGQFGDGTLRIYRNVGTAAAPKFADYQFFRAGDEEAKVPFG